MKVLIKSALVLDPASDSFNQKRDILINNGRIEKISNKLPEPKTVINGKRSQVVCEQINYRQMRYQAPLPLPESVQLVAGDR